MTKERLFEFLILLGALEYRLESFAVEMDKALITNEMINEIDKNTTLN